MTGGLGVDDQRSGLRDVPMLLLVVPFCGIGPNRNSPDHNEEHLN
jgi:hypothetical protein